MTGKGHQATYYLRSLDRRLCQGQKSFNNSRIEFLSRMTSFSNSRQSLSFLVNFATRPIAVVAATNYSICACHGSALGFDQQMKSNGLVVRLYM